jgi:hypothetical protein
MDAHPGNGINAVRSISANVTNDSAVLNQGRTPSTNPNLDPFAHANGYRDGGLTLYSDSFKQSYFKAQSDRMNFLISEALARLDDINAVATAMRPSSCRSATTRAWADRPDDPPQHAAAEEAREERRQHRRHEPVTSVRVQSLSPGDETGFGSSCSSR